MQLYFYHLIGGNVVLVAGVGLKCYSCINAEIGILSTNLNVNEECGSPTSETPVQSCPSDGKTYMCAYLESTSRAAFGMFNSC